MSGLGLVLSIAKDALAAQSYGLDVTSHNVANVNTEGYSRQRPVYESKIPALFGGVYLGRGVNTDQVERISDQFIEDQLTQRKSTMASSEEMENYMRVLEGLFSESGETSLSTMLSGFWNLWHDLANNPSGASERIALYEHSLLLSEQFNSLDADLKKVETDLTFAADSGIVRINQITGEIAQINDQITELETIGMANDLRDKRNTLVSELAEYLDVKTFEQSNGSLTVISVRGCILVEGISSYDLKLDGDSVAWEGSGGNETDITNYLTRGKLGGWLDVRDGDLAKYELDLDALAEGFIWAVNDQHSQGVGLEAFSTLTGTYQASNKTLALASSGLPLADKIVDGGFTLWVYDANGQYVSDTAITIDADVTPLDNSVPNDLVTQITDADANLNAIVTASGKLQITADNGYTFAFSDDTSHVLAALGLNTFFIGTTAGSIRVSDTIGENKNFIAAAEINKGVTDYGNIAAGDNTNALAMVDLQYASQTISRWTCDRINGHTEGVVSSTVEDYYHSMVGSIGIRVSSISRSRSFNEAMANKISSVRDSISAVSIDEEMTNLIKFQHAYAAAAKLITITDEMLNTLLGVK